MVGGERIYPRSGVCNLQGRNSTPTTSRCSSSFAEPKIYSVVQASGVSYSPAAQPNPSHPLPGRVLLHHYLFHIPTAKHKIEYVVKSRGGRDIRRRQRSCLGPPAFAYGDNRRDRSLGDERLPLSTFRYRLRPRFDVGSDQGEGKHERWRGGRSWQ